MIYKVKVGPYGGWGKIKGRMVTNAVRWFGDHTVIKGSEWMQYGEESCRTVMEKSVQNAV